MRHPEDLLAAFVDGTASLQERAEVESHLSFCATCRDEIELAKEARVALEGLPELEAPAVDLAFVTMAPAPVAAASDARPPFGQAPEVGLAPESRPEDRRPSPRTVRRRWPVRAAQATMAAAAVAVAIAVFSGLGGGGRNTTSATRPQGAAQAPAASPSAAFGGALQVYDKQTIAALARNLSSEIRHSAAKVPSSPVGSSTTAPSDASLTDQGVACMERGTGVVAGTSLYYFQRAVYEGTDAYIGAFLTGTGKSRSLLVVVVGVDGCQPLQFIRQAI